MPSRPASALFVLLMALAVVLLAGRAAITVRDADISDFRCFYEAGRLAAAGEDPYDRAVWRAATVTDPARVPHCAKTFIYPLWTALAMTPLTVLPEQTALAVWEAVLLACILGAVALLARTWTLLGGSKVLLLAVLWSQPTFSAIANAQFGPVILLGVAALGHAQARGDARAAPAWWLLLLKPHITALVLAGTLLRQGRRATAVLIAGALGIAVVTLVLIPSWPLDLIRENFAQQQLLGDRGLGTLWTLSSDLGLPAALGGVVGVLLVGGIVAALRRRALLGREVVALLIGASFLLTPYVRPHDLVVLAPCWAVALAAARPVRGSSGVGFAAAAVAVAVVIPRGVTLLSLAGAPLSLYVLVSVATAALTVVALRRTGAPVADQGPALG